MNKNTVKTIKDECLITKIINIHASCFSVIYNYTKHFFKVIKIPRRGEIYVYQAFYYRKRVFVLHVIEMSAFILLALLYIIN